MDFTSQICTTKEQSERLLALGLKKETADMFYSHDKGEDIYAIRACWKDFWDSNKLIDGHIRRHCIPAWSLHRLIEMLPMNINNDGRFEDILIHPNYNRWVVKYSGIFREPTYQICKKELIDALYDMVVTLKEEGVV